MIRLLILIFALLVNATSVKAQDVAEIDSLKNRLISEATDSGRIWLMNGIAANYRFVIPDSLFVYAYQALKLSKATNDPKGEVAALLNIVIGLRNLGNDSKAFQIALNAIKLAEKHQLLEDKGLLLIQMGTFYNQSQKYSEAFERFREAKMLFDSIGNPYFSVIAKLYIAEVHEQLGDYDSAIVYGRMALQQAQEQRIGRIDRSYNFLGRIFILKGQYDSAIKYLPELVFEGDKGLYERNYNRASLFHKLNKTDSAIMYGQKALEAGLLQHSFSSIRKSGVLLSLIFERANKDSSLKYLKLAMHYQDSILNLGKISALEGFSEYDEQERKAFIESEKQAYIQKIRWGFMLFGFIALGSIAILMYRNYKKEKNARNLIDKKNSELEKAMTTLKSTQSQLIQSEKMASLGELTAGIAHEIQNPLNFVNNFSEVSKELIGELSEEVDKGNYEEVKLIAVDVVQNLEKINHHGKRADAIVKGMLQHSRTSSGQKEPTDINALCDEYLRLAYHGLKAKDPSFNASFHFERDETLPLMNVVSQDISRVLLNLFNNAFQAVAEMQKTADVDYAAEVRVSTKLIFPPAGSQAERREGTKFVRGAVIVSDNGPGIPESIKGKIFQPFFTTKPTGQGTGLGLSLSYDIVKAHGGELKVETKEGEGSSFTIQLPV